MIYFIFNKDKKNAPLDLAAHYIKQKQIMIKEINQIQSY
tara:strand:- start:1969 stop:2085 length:117 start_codon:yes stop_codon:yes gene_type:complete